MTQNLLTAGNAASSAALSGGNDGTFNLVVGPSGSQVNALTSDATGQVALPSNSTNKLVSATGTAPVYGCRAWCNFDGTLTGTNAPRAGGNVTSVTRNAVGDYTINFAIALPDANYAIALGSVGYTSTNTSTYLLIKAGATTTVPTLKTASSLGVAYCSTASNYFDAAEVNVMIFR